MKPLSSAASAQAAGKGRRLFTALLPLVAVFLLGGADRYVGPRGSDPVTEISRLLDRTWDETDPYITDRRTQLKNLADRLDNLGDLSRAVFLPWFNAADPVAEAVHDRVITRFKKQMHEKLQHGTVDQRIAAPTCWQQRPWARGRGKPCPS